VSTGRSEDEAWRSIVDNYGDRPRLDEPPAEPPDPAPFNPTDEEVDAWEDEPTDRFIPPDPPPHPPLPWTQRVAWLGVLGSPALLVVAVLSGLPLPSPLGYALVIAFAGGFLYLVATMRTGREPWDDGARL
jgi:hypothetical protein